MTIFSGLFTYEIVLLVLGVLLFLVILFMLVFSVLRQQKITVYSSFFLISLVMMGFPGIQKVKIDRNGVEIDRLVKELQQHPNDQKAYKALTQKLDEIKKREPVLGPSMLLTVAQAQVAIGQKGQALKNVDKVMRLAPNSSQAHTARILKEGVAVPSQVEGLKRPQPPTPQQHVQPGPEPAPTVLPKPKPCFISVYAIPNNGVTRVKEGNICDIEISAGFGSRAEAENERANIFFEVKLNNIMLVAHKRGGMRGNGGKWHLYQSYKTRELAKGNYLVNAITYRRPHQYVDSRTFTIQVE